MHNVDMYVPSHTILDWMSANIYLTTVVASANTFFNFAYSSHNGYVGIFPCWIIYKVEMIFNLAGFNWFFLLNLIN